jgi:hypothetical protein
VGELVEIANPAALGGCPHARPYIEREVFETSGPVWGSNEGAGRGDSMRSLSGWHAQGPPTTRRSV